MTGCGEDEAAVYGNDNLARPAPVQNALDPLPDTHLYLVSVLRHTAPRSRLAVRGRMHRRGGAGDRAFRVVCTATNTFDY